MTLQERLREDLKEAMRQRDELRRSTIRFILAAVQNEEIAQRKPLDDAGVINVLARLARQHLESIEEFRRGQRPQMAEREEAELAIVRHYMPAQLSREEIAQLAREVIASTGARGSSDMGKVMGLLMRQVRGRADGAQVSQVVTELLAG